MGQIKIIKKKNQRFLLYKSTRNEMILRKDIDVINSYFSDNMMPASYEKKHNQMYLYYCLDDCISLHEFFGMMTVNRKLFITLLRQFVDFLKVIDEKLMNPHKIIFNPNMVFIVPSNRKLKFIYVPTEYSFFEDTASDFLKNIIEDINFSFHENNNYINEFLAIINENEDVSMYRLELFVRKYRNTNSANGRASNLLVNESIKKRCPICHAIINSSEAFCSSCGSRNMSNYVGHYILRRSNQEKIFITKFPFLIGKIENINGYFVRDNELVSRNHLKIYYEDGNYYICDSGSTNGTYINGRRLKEHVKYEIKNGTVFFVANEEFIFYV